MGSINLSTKYQRSDRVSAIKPMNLMVWSQKFLEGVHMVRRMLITVSILCFSVVGLWAQRPDFANNRYFVGFNQPLTNDEPAFLQSQGARLGKVFPEVQAIEITIENMEQ